MLNLERTGPRGGPTLVLLHPMGADLRFWNPCRDLWQDRFDCLALDLPAAGASPDLPGTLTLPRQAAAVAETLAAERVTEIIPIGCAVGAMTATELAALPGPRLRGLILSNPGLATKGAAREALARRAQAVRQHGIEAALPDALGRAFHNQPQDEAFHAYRARFSAQSPERYARQIEGMLDADISAALKALTVPVLIIVGGQDLLLPAEIGRGIAAALPNAELLDYPDAAHFIPWQQPARFAQDAASWLARLA